MKIIKNDSYNGREITLKSPTGPISEWLAPKESIAVPDNALSNTIRNLAKQRILKITNS